MFMIYYMFALTLCPIIGFCSDLPWWKHTIIYEVYIRSFKDSDGDGIGDLNGVIKKLDHFSDLNIETLWLSPYSKSPMKDMGYDVSDFMNVDPIFGTLADFDTLAAGVKKRNMKLIMDLVLNHTSDQHTWFQKSIDGIKPYADYYIWKDPREYDGDGDPVPPNDWYSCFGGYSWTWNEKRKQFYYHFFTQYQPDLNLKNPKVINEIKKIITFWIRRGINGFRLDATPYLIEDFDVADVSDTRGIEYRMNLPETYEIIHNLRTFLDKRFNRKTNHQTEFIFIAESVQRLQENIKYYGNENFRIVHYPFNFDFLIFPPMNPMQRYISPNAEYFDYQIKNWLNTIPKGEVVNWVTESHDLPRISERINEGYRDLFVTLTMMLPGAVSIYYGQEIGMTGYTFNQDPEEIEIEFRDRCRNPMQWDDSYQAGFSTSKRTWLPINPDYWAVNVDAQKKETRSHYQMFKKLSSLRLTNTLKEGEFSSYIPSKWVYLFTRKLANHDTYIVVLNFGSEVEKFDMVSLIKSLPESIEVATSSVNSHYVPGTTIFVKPQGYSDIVMRPFSSVVFVTGPLTDIVRTKKITKKKSKKAVKKGLIDNNDYVSTSDQQKYGSFVLPNNGKLDISDIASLLHDNAEESSVDHSSAAAGKKDDRGENSKLNDSQSYTTIDDETSKGPLIKPISDTMFMFSKTNLD